MIFSIQIVPSRGFYLSLGLIIAVLAGGFGLTMPAAHAQPPGGSTMNYEGVELAQVAREIGFRTSRTFVLDPAVTGRVTIISPPDQALTDEEVWAVFLWTLQVNGYSVVPIGDRQYKIVPAAEAIREGQFPSGTAAAGAQTVTRVIPLRFANAATVSGNLQGLKGDNAILTPIRESNALIMVDTAANVQRVLDVVRDIDVDDSIVRTVPLTNAIALNVAATLEEIIAAGRPADSAGPAMSIVPVQSSNSLILRGSPQEVNRLLPIVRELDTVGTGQSTLDHIYLNHADAEQLVPIIETLLGTGPGGEGGAGAVSGPTVAAHIPTNALIINAPPDLQQTIRSIVARLDIRRPQVQIEAIIVEMSNTMARELGVQYVSGGDGIPPSVASFTNTSPNIVSAAGAAYFLSEDDDEEFRTITTTDPDGTVIVTEEPIFDDNDPENELANQLVDAAVSDLLNFNGFLTGIGFETEDGGVFGLLVSAIQSDAQSNVLSVPHVTLLDNETGRLSVGQEIPVETGQAQGLGQLGGAGGFTTVERQDVGNILEVTPQINAGNTVSLQIRIEISSIGAFTSQTDRIITNKALVETYTSVDDGQVLVIGGLIDNDQRFTESKVPVLGDIPLLGNLFKGQTRNNEESMLMVFIRPTILRDAEMADRVTARKYDYVQERQRVFLRGTDALTLLDQRLNDYIGPAEEPFVAAPPPIEAAMSPLTTDAPAEEF